MGKDIKLEFLEDYFSYDYLYAFLSTADVLNKGEKANVYKLGDKVYKVFDAPMSYEYIKNQAYESILDICTPMEIFSGKLEAAHRLDIPFVATPDKIIYNSDSIGNKDVIAYRTNYIGDEYMPGSRDYETTIMLYQDLAKKLYLLGESGLIIPDGSNFGNIRIMKDNTFGFTDLDGMQLNDTYKTRSRTDHFDRFLSTNPKIASSYYIENGNIYGKDVNVFNHIALFLLDTIGLNISKYNEDFIEQLICDTGIQNESINEKIRKIFSREKKVYFTDEDFMDLKNNYEIIENNTSLIGTPKKFNLK